MSKNKIPYFFDTPIPIYFRSNGWFQPRKDGRHLKIMNFLIWSFSRCSTQKRVVFHDHKEISLEPYEFIFGINKCSEETGLSVQEIKTIINQLFSIQNGSLLEKTTNSVTNRFTCYKWVTSHFSENTNQLINQPPTNRQPTANHNIEDRSKKKEEEHTLSNQKAQEIPIELKRVSGGGFVNSFSFNSSKEEISDDEILEPRPLPKTVELKHTFGIEEVVELTFEEHKKLMKVLSKEEFDFWVRQVELEILRKGVNEFNKKNQSHYAVILAFKEYRESKNLGFKTNEITSPEENIKFAQFINQNYYSPYYRLDILNDRVEFVQQSGSSGQFKEIKFKEKGFKDLLQSEIHKKGFKKR